MPNNQPTFAQAEPTIIGEAFRSLLLAVIGLLQVFDVIHWTPEQQGAVLLVFVAVSALITVLVRSKVTPGGGPPPADNGSITLYDIVLVAALVVAILGAIVLWRKV